MIKELTPEEQHYLGLQYWKIDLFRHWSTVINQFTWTEPELDLVSIWATTDGIIESLRSVDVGRDQLIPVLLQETLRGLWLAEQQKEEGERRELAQVESTAVTIFTVLLTRLLNAVEKGHEDEAFDNEPVCTAIACMIGNHPRFVQLHKRLFKRKVGFDGKKIEIEPSDPLKKKEPVKKEGGRKSAKEEKPEARLLKLTSGLQPLFGEQWNGWEDLCRRLCLDDEIRRKLHEVKPRNNEWNMNQKMLCNVIGIYKDCKKIQVSMRTINSVLSTKQLRHYIGNHANYKASDTDLDKVLHRRIEKMVKEV